MKYVVTTSYRPTKEMVELAKNLASKYGVKYVNRRHLAKTLQLEKIDFYYVIDKNLMISIKWGNEKFFFHQGIAKIRMENIFHGEKDYLIESVKPTNNSVIYDATCGLASEALLLAHFAEKVVATEGSIHIYRIVKWGLERYKSNVEWINNAAKKIELIHSNYKEYIRMVKDNTFDSVYCDPMFENPIFESNSINPLRGFAVYEPLNIDDIEEMLRISTKRVVIKTHKKDSLYKNIKHLFNEEYLSKKSGVVYGVIVK
ncbi:class I SAM-dependent methyltransferase [Thermosipho atlanticus]|uniref:Putative SAM-dependent methyltransferase n=1 Tax=Thermosipho atlanticus DSM 15807 TaxID=1123380 RepID=A0A1M5R595_9BACT|nr:class I SAM-dependent methyltransferase [Thermosipho atlanticus]SHH21391.1 Putative SAM-dependent methyltransferase [Thermosipho atlanticus DSM 15807]